MGGLQQLELQEGYSSRGGGSRPLKRRPLSG